MKSEKHVARAGTGLHGKLEAEVAETRATLVEAMTTGAAMIRDLEAQLAAAKMDAGSERAARSRYAEAFEKERSARIVSEAAHAETWRLVEGVAERWTHTAHWEECDARPEDDDDSDMTGDDWAQCCCSAGAFRTLLLAARVRHPPGKP
jgi:hypothetical protein